jgi:hypothetical protein
MDLQLYSYSKSSLSIGSWIVVCFLSALGGVRVEASEVAAPSDGTIPTCELELG